MYLDTKLLTQITRNFQSIFIAKIVDELYINYKIMRAGTRSWSRYVQMCASYLTIQRTTLVGAFEIRFRTLVYEQLETRETLTLTLTGNCLNLTTGTQVVRCTVS